MSTFIINLNDTITMSDSAVVELAKVINTCQPCVKEAQTNCNDVWIAGIICLAIVMVALIAKCGLLAWKSKEIEAADAERKAKETEANIAARKQKADALGKLLDFLEKNTTTEEYSKEEGKRIKKLTDFTSKESQYYIDVLKTVVKGGDIPDFSKKG